MAESIGCPKCGNLATSRVRPLHLHPSKESDWCSVKWYIDIALALFFTGLIFACVANAPSQDVDDLSDEVIQYPALMKAWEYMRSRPDEFEFKNGGVRELRTGRVIIPTPRTVAENDVIDPHPRPKQSSAPRPKRKSTSQRMEASQDSVNKSTSRSKYNGE